MLRATLFGIFVGTAAMAGCSKDAETPAVAAHAAAGKVVAISGKVEAIRGGQTRALAMNSEIFADDEVVVGADGSVGIDLVHNNARWSLEAGRRGKVRDSVAWTMAKVDTPTKPVEHATSAAGREGERAAATTSNTEAGSAAAAAAPPPAPEPEPVRGDAPGGGAPSPPKPADKPVEPRRRTTGSGPDLGTLGQGKGTGTGQGYGAGTGRLGSDHKTRAIKPQNEVMPTAPIPPPPPPPAPKDAESETPLEKALRAQKATLQKCAGSAGLKVKVSVARSVASVVIVSGKTADAAATIKCMETALRQIKFAPGEAAVVLEL